MKRSRLTGIFVSALGLFVLLVLIPVGIVSPANVGSLALAPESWPIIVASMLTLVGVLLIFAPGPSESSDDSRVVIDSSWASRAAMVVGALFAAYFLVPLVGMIVTGMALILGFSWFAGERRVAILAALSVAPPLLFAAFFLFVAKVSVPLGAFEFFYVRLH